MYTFGSFRFMFVICEIRSIKYYFWTWVFSRMKRLPSNKWLDSLWFSSSWTQWCIKWVISFSLVYLVIKMISMGIYLISKHIFKHFIVPSYICEKPFLCNSMFLPVILLHSFVTKHNSKLTPRGMIQFKQMVRFPVIFIQIKKCMISPWSVCLVINVIYGN